MSLDACEGGNRCASSVGKEKHATRYGGPSIGGALDWITNTIFEFQTSDVSRALALRAGFR